MSAFRNYRNINFSKVNKTTYTHTSDIGGKIAKDIRIWSSMGVKGTV